VVSGHFAENVILGEVIHNAGQFFGEMYHNHRNPLLRTGKYEFFIQYKDIILHNLYR